MKNVFSLIMWVIKDRVVKSIWKVMSTVIGIYLFVNYIGFKVFPIYFIHFPKDIEKLDY